jgi:SAM-dependent methyltransferase
MAILLPSRSPRKLSIEIIQECRVYPTRTPGPDSLGRAVFFTNVEPVRGKQKQQRSEGAAHRMKTELQNRTGILESPLHAQEKTSSLSLCCPGCGQSELCTWRRAPDRMHGRQRFYTLLRCTQCSLVWLENAPPLEEMADHYGAAYHRLVQQAAESSPRRWQRHALILEQYKQSGTLLDLGCSSGAFLESLKGQQWQLYGVEISAEAAEKARARTGAEVFVGDVQNAPFQPNSFDAITCFDVLEHMHQAREVLLRVREWLKPGGVFYTFLPNIDSAESRIFRSYWCGLELPRHLYHFTPQSLRRLAESVGLEPLCLTTVPNAQIEYDVRYVCDDILKYLGFPRKPVSEGFKPTFAGKVVRKALRVTLINPFSKISSAFGFGQSIRAILQKPMQDSDSIVKVRASGK